MMQDDLRRQQTDPYSNSLNPSHGFKRFKCTLATHTHTDAHIHTQTHAHTHRRPHTHTHTLRHTHSDTHTQTHTHIQSRVEHTSGYVHIFSLRGLYLSNSRQHSLSLAFSLSLSLSLSLFLCLSLSISLCVCTCLHSFPWCGQTYLLYLSVGVSEAVEKGTMGEGETKASG